MARYQLVFLQAQNTDMCIDQALMLIKDGEDPQSCRYNDAVNDIVRGATVAHVLYVELDYGTAAEIGEDRPYFG